MSKGMARVPTGDPIEGILWPGRSRTKSSIAGCEGVVCARRWRADSPRSPHTRRAANRRRGHCATPSPGSRPPCRNCATTSGAPTERPPVGRRPKHGARTRSGAAPRRARPAEVDRRRNSRGERAVGRGAPGRRKLKEAPAGPPAGVLVSVGAPGWGGTHLPGSPNPQFAAGATTRTVGGAGFFR